MKITRAQRLHLFIDYRDRSGRVQLSLWTRVCEHMNWDKDDRKLRLDFFSRSLGRRIESSSEIGKLKDFDTLKAECLAILQPSNLDAQMRQAEMPHTRLVYAIRQLAPEAYIIAEAHRKFGGEVWESLNESDLTMLRNHLAARAAHLRWPEQKLARQAEAVAVGEENPF